MEIILSQTSSQPIYEQIVMQIKEMIMKGTLKADDPLPSMRKMAKDLHVSIITTQRAYEELAKDGFVTYVARANQDFIKEENLRRIEKMLSDVCILARQNGIAIEELKTLLQYLYQEE